ncbi:VCBS repeat-containing protein [soil metagenome]
MLLLLKYLRYSLLFFLIADFQPSAAQYTLLSAKQTGVKFTNKLTESEDQNVLAYEYFYNGGGVAVGDLNNDGLPDLYFTGNMVPDRLYINQGDLKFKDVSGKAGINKETGWKTGVTLVDINQDGWLDIYVCYSGNGDAFSRKNKLFINNKNLTFTEKAAEYGLDLPSHSTHAVFFDYDKDGDLDCYLLNHNIKDFKRFDAEAVKAMRDEFAGDKLLRNDNGKFTEVSAEAGIKGNPIGFGLGVAVADINRDGWSDIMVSNDYIEQDYLYINNGNGTFSDQLDKSVGHVSYFSMGNEIADINNDGLPDLFTLDMLPEDNRRQKLLFGPENYETYANMLQNKFYHQLMRNMMHLNNGDGTFSEIGQQLGISNTDWSWAPLIADFDNDGFKDIFITNGYLRDYTNMDFMKFYADKELKRSQGNPTALMDIVKEMPSTATHNYMFRNTGNLSFENMVHEWGFSDPILSNGAVFADLNNDGNLEIITNNVNREASIYQNTGSSSNHFLQVQLGENYPIAAIGAQVWIYANGNLQFQEYQPSRGFQSSMYTPLHFGLGTATVVDSLRIVWADNTSQVLTNVPANQKIVLQPQNAKQIYNWNKRKERTVFSENESKSISFDHVEQEFNDFKRQSLLPNMLSYQGPHISQADVNGNGLVDLYVGGAKGQPGVLFIQQEDGTSNPSSQPAFDKDFFHEDTDAIFFDADMDGDMDLYVVSGGYIYMEVDVLLQDRLYLNDGNGNFTRATDNLPAGWTSNSTVTVIDIDNDGDPDLFVGGRVKPGKYPEPVNSYLLINDGTGKFSDGTAQHAPFLANFGLVTDAVAIDIDNDGWKDLVVVGEYMPVTYLKNNNGVFNQQGTLGKVSGTKGWWNRIVAEDLDNDGDLDLIIGNYGWNNQLNPSEAEPVAMTYGDFDQNEAIDPLLTYYIQGKPYPLVSRDEALNQLFFLRKKFTDYKSYAEASLEDILTPEQIEQAKKLKAETFSSVVLENNGDGTFTWHELPAEAQFSPVYAIALLDVDGDGLKDLILGGNLIHTRIKIGKMDANYGMLFKNKGNCKFTYVPQYQSGLGVKGDVRDIVIIKRGNENILLFGRNNDTIVEYLHNDENFRSEKF